MRRRESADLSEFNLTQEIVFNKQITNVAICKHLSGKQRVTMSAALITKPCRGNILANFL
ncbi:hypothetical protein GCM10009124_30490 [Shewanella xiamenensis]|nr:hypothetical protein GCM10009124_30490 [Shewanella xiamenensis]